MTITSGSRPLRILITTPLMSRPGGVSQYLRVLQPHMRNNMCYFTIGTRCDSEPVEQSHERPVRRRRGQRSEKE